VPWGGVDWGLYDNSSYSLAPEQVWDNFVHDRKATNGESK
jgi:hypothetical protein